MAPTLDDFPGLQEIARSRGAEADVAEYLANDLRNVRQARLLRIAVWMLGALVATAAVLSWTSMHDVVEHYPESPVLPLLLLSAYAVMLGLYTVALWLIRRARRRTAHSSFAVAVLKVITALQRSSDRWSDWSYKSTILKQLEDCARSIERSARAMSACDRANDASILLRNHQIGAYVRSLKQWVLVPTDLTYCDLLDLLNHIAYDACSERWERLPRLTELSMVKTPWYHVTARTAVRTAPTLVLAAGLAAAYRAGIAIDLTTALTLLVISLVVGNALAGGNLATESLPTKILDVIGKRGGKSE